MDNLDKSRTNLMISSVVMILLFGGLATFGDKIELPLLGLQIKNSNVFPAVLVVLWIYFLQRFTSLSSAKHSAEIASALRENFNKKHLVKSLFPPAEFKLATDCEVVARPWLAPADQPGITFSPVIYKRYWFARVIEFSYQSPDLHVHFLDQKSKEWGQHLQRGRVVFPSWRFLKCAYAELKFLVKNIQGNPVIVPYYFPRLLALAAAVAFAVWVAR
jgi:hypothetical protein